MQNCFKAVLKNCGIRNANFHLLRHTYATVCIESGFDAKTVSELLGHITLNIHVSKPTEVLGKAELTGNVNINTVLKAFKDVKLNGEVLY